ncbi:MAG TPA: ATP-binding protein, partial [Thermoanaerobaculia bacterium]|nr:ATP-binding protein [Thermoanaerobaculia bacterium]
DVDETLRDAYVPAFLLQPLVENAIRHGALASLGRGTVSVRVARDNGAMAITVSNDGELLDPSGWREGIGLSSTRARLAQMYGDAEALSIDAAEGAVSVGVRIPLRLRK